MPRNHWPKSRHFVSCLQADAAAAAGRCSTNTRAGGGLPWRLVTQWPTVRRHLCASVPHPNVSDARSVVSGQEAATWRLRLPAARTALLPQFCRDLLAGVDLTISHRNVNKYPLGIKCEPSKAASKLSIHGLWPNYNAGFSACCNVSAAIRNRPFDALGFAAESPELLSEMDKVWVDPTQPSSFHTLCELYNHEFQKHGLCYAANGGADFDASARGYFNATMRAAAVYKDATAAINHWAAQSSPKTTLAAITALYKTRVQVLCSAIAPADGSSNGGNNLAAIHVCFSKPTSASAAFIPIDCKDASSTAVFVPCSPGVAITLIKYTAPSPAIALEL